MSVRVQQHWPGAEVHLRGVTRHVPMLAWFLAGARERLDVNEGALRQIAAQPLSHDNLAPTLLGLFGVHTSAVRSELDMMAGARRAAPR